MDYKEIITNIIAKEWGGDLDSIIPSLNEGLNPVSQSIYEWGSGEGKSWIEVRTISDLNLPIGSGFILTDVSGSVKEIQWSND
jgi:hypothetical protein